MEFSVLLSVHTKEILENMKSDAIITLETLFLKSYKENSIYHNGKSYTYNSKILQELVSNIIENIFFDAPKINNYTLNHTIVDKNKNTTIIKNYLKLC